MSVIPLRGSRRESVGKGGARKARAAGQIPGVVYGHGEAPFAIAVAELEFSTAMRGHKGANPIVTLDLGGNAVTALMRAVQRDPVTQHVLHLDFQHISLTETIEVEVALHLVGTPIGVKDGGGILEQVRRTLDIRCLPTSIPSAIDADVSALAVGQSLHVSDLSVQGVTIITAGDTTLAVVVAPLVEEAPAAAEGVPGAAEPEVLATKGKKEEGADAKKPDAKKPDAKKPEAKK